MKRFTISHILASYQMDALKEGHEEYVDAGEEERRR